MNPDLRAEFHLASQSLPIVDLAESLPEARITIDEILRTGADHTVLLCWIETDAFEDAENALGTEKSIADWSLLESAGRKRLYRLRLVEGATVLIAIEERFIERGATPIRATVTSDGWRMQARFPDRASLVEYRERCDQRGIDFRLERLYEPIGDGADDTDGLARLTPKQRQALVLAYEGGYYEIPRASTLDELSGQIDISRRSLSDRLRRAERRVIGYAIAESSR